MFIKGRGNKMRKIEEKAIVDTMDVLHAVIHEACSYKAELIIDDGMSLDEAVEYARKNIMMMAPVSARKYGERYFRDEEIKNKNLFYIEKRVVHNGLLALFTKDKFVTEIVDIFGDFLRKNDVKIINTKVDGSDVSDNVFSTSDYQTMVSRIDALVDDYELTDSMILPMHVMHLINAMKNVLVNTLADIADDGRYIGKSYEYLDYTGIYNELLKQLNKWKVIDNKVE